MQLSISELEQLSGVPVHTIRIWERRYNALQPLRSAGNTRSYTDEHLRRLLNIVSLNQAGLKISQVCSLSANEIDDFLAKEFEATVSSTEKYEFYIAQLLKFGLSYNETDFCRVLDNCIVDNGIQSTYEEVILQVLQRVGLMWRREHICPAQEHFISAIVRQKLMVAIDALPNNQHSEQTWMLFLPEDEGHDIPLLFASFLLRSKGYKVIYLGERVPILSLKDAYHATRVDKLLLFMIRQRPVKEANHYLSVLGEEFRGSEIYLAGNAKLLDEINAMEKITKFNTIDELKELLLARV